MRAFWLSCLLVLVSCAPDLRDDYPFDGALPDGDYLVSTDEPDGTTFVTVDATNKTSWVYVDLDVGDEVPADQIGDNTWDLAFQRFVVKSNSGNGIGTARVAVVKDGDFAALTVAPADGYLEDGNEPVFNTAEGGWYFYDLGVHKLITREDLFYVVKTSAGAYFKVKMKSYYDENGTAARMQLWWQKIDPPTP